MAVALDMLVSVWWLDHRTRDLPVSVVGRPESVNCLFHVTVYMISQCWKSVFPGVFRDGSEESDTLHFQMAAQIQKCETGEVVNIMFIPG